MAPGRTRSARQRASAAGFLLPLGRDDLGCGTLKPDARRQRNDVETERPAARPRTRRGASVPVQPVLSDAYRMQAWKPLLAASLIGLAAVTTITVAEPDLAQLCRSELAHWPLLALPLHLDEARQLRPDLYQRDITPLPAASASLASECGASLGAYTAWFYHQLARDLGVTGDCTGLEEADCHAVLTCTSEACGIRPVVPGCENDPLTCPLEGGCTETCGALSTTAGECSQSMSAPSTTSSKLAPPESDPCKEYCSPSLNKDMSQYRNGDCACDSFPRSSVDLDGDGALNDHDTDDDCDRLSDTLEALPWLNPSVPNDPLAMVPGGGAVKVKFDFYGLDWQTDEWDRLGEGDAGGHTPDGTQYPDPYLSWEYSVSSTTGGTPLVVPKFNINEHPWQVDGDGYTWPQAGGVTAGTVSLEGLPAAYDSSVYMLRNGAAGVGSPMVWMSIFLMEDDTGGDRGGDDTIWGNEEPMFDISQFSLPHVSSAAVASGVWELSKLDLFRFDVKINTNLSTCAIQYAGQVAAGLYEVDSSDVASFPNCL